MTAPKQPENAPAGPNQQSIRGHRRNHSAPAVWDTEKDPASKTLKRLDLLQEALEPLFGNPTPEQVTDALDALGNLTAPIEALKIELLITAKQKGAPEKRRKSYSNRELATLLRTDESNIRRWLDNDRVRERLGKQTKK